MASKRAYLGLGSNLGDRRGNLQRALQALEGPALRVMRVSSLYETEPRDLPGQPWFLNLVAEVETTLFPMQLLTRGQRVERTLGRTRGVPKGPRTMDIDLLLYGHAVISTGRLTVPHPRMAERRFVLEPLAELAAEHRHPLTGRTVGQLLEALTGQAVRRLGPLAEPPRG